MSDIYMSTKKPYKINQHFDYQYVAHFLILPLAIYVYCIYKCQLNKTHVCVHPLYMHVPYVCLVAAREQRGGFLHDKWHVPWCVCAPLPGPVV